MAQVEMSAEALQKRRSSKTMLVRGALLGLIPLGLMLLTFSTMYLDGYQCGTTLINLLTVLALGLEGTEVLVGVVCLFRKHIRAFAASLLLSLLLSALLGSALASLGLWVETHGLPLLCHISG